MMKGFSLRRIIAVAICCLLIAGMLPAFSYADASGSETGTLTVKLNSELFAELPDTPAAEFTLYKIGDWSKENSAWLEDEPFREEGIFSAKSGDQLTEIAKRVYDIIQKNDEYLSAGKAVKVDSTGSAVFEDVGRGVYLLALTDGPEGLAATPVFILMPTNEKGTLLFELESEAKAEFTPTEEPTPSPTPTPTPVVTDEPTPTPVVTDEPTPTPVITEVPTPVPTPVITEEPTPEPTPEITEEPTPTPEPTEEPTPTPSPTPAIDVPVSKVWDDNNDEHDVRPDSITVYLMANGIQLESAVLTASGGWTYTFTDLPLVNANGVRINYTVSEVPVTYYRDTVSGTTLINHIIPSVPSEYTSVSGTKTWNDNNNVDGVRPNYITIVLYRNGEYYAERNVTAATNWNYTFDNLPADDGYGHKYTYTIREIGIPGYFSRLVDGASLVNTRLSIPTPPPSSSTPPPGTTPPPRTPPQPPVESFSEDELDELFDLFDYDTPLFGFLLGTGEEDAPLYPYIFAGIGVVAVIVLIVFGRKRKHKEVRD